MHAITEKKKKKKKKKEENTKQKKKRSKPVFYFNYLSKLVFKIFIIL